MLSSAASFCFAVSVILQFLHYDGSQKLVSCSSSLSKHENLVLRGVFRIRSYQELLAGVHWDGRGSFTLFPAPCYCFPLVPAGRAHLSGIFYVLLNTSNIHGCL